VLKEKVRLEGLAPEVQAVARQRMYPYPGARRRDLPYQLYGMAIERPDQVWASGS
jgi:hypothetical protein